MNLRSVAVFFDGIRLPAGPPAVGQVWTATDTSGNGTWQTATGGTLDPVTMEQWSVD